ncbi:MAG: phage tail protein [Synergistaceae bacterium]|nr:phage tail protein [Synergistaceae bacterium]
MIGSLDNVIFEVDSEKSILTFDDLSESHSANYAEHNILNGRGMLEFTGIKASSISFMMSLNMTLGINPDEQIRRLISMLEDHEAVNFILAGIPKGNGRWVIESLDVKHKLIDNRGYTRHADVNIKLREYISIDE